MDEEHVLIKCPIDSGSYYFNCKSTCSIVLLALVDTYYKFIFVDAGCNGRASDGGVCRNSSLGDAFEHKSNVWAASLCCSSRCTSHLNIYY